MTISERHHELGLNAGKLVEYAQSLERERNHLREENDRLRQTIGKFEFRRFYQLFKDFITLPGDDGTHRMFRRHPPFLSRESQRLPRRVGDRIAGEDRYFRSVQSLLAVAAPILNEMIKLMNSHGVNWSGANAIVSG